jgi:iron complex transport system substrate-binding protein
MAKPPPQIIATIVASALTLIGVAAFTYWVMMPWPKTTHHNILDSDQSNPSNINPETSNPTPTIASLTPAGTDLIIGIGAADHLVAVSDQDDERQGTEGLPKVGDFDHVDWEKLAAAKPQILLTQFGSRMPSVLRQRCDQMGIQVIDIKLDTIEDVYADADIVGSALGEQVKEAQAVAEVKRELAAVAASVANLPQVRAAIAVSDGEQVSLIGPGTFHDELLTIAGGINVAAKFNKPYIAIDREQLTQLSPAVVLDLEPVPPTTPQQMRQAARFWSSLPDLPAVQAKQIHTITEPYCLRPGWHLADLAEVFAENLHGRGK